MKDVILSIIYFFLPFLRPRKKPDKLEYYELSRDRITRIRQIHRRIRPEVVRNIVLANNMFFHYLKKYLEERGIELDMKDVIGLYKVGVIEVEEVGNHVVVRYNKREV